MSFVVCRLRAIAIDDDAHTGCHRQRPPGDDERLAQGVIDALRQDRHRGRLLDLLAQDNEFIVAQASGALALPHLPLQAAGDGFEQQIPDFLAMGMVDQLEAVYIDEQQCRARFVTARALQGAVNACACCAMVGQASQGIMFTP